MLYYVSFGVSEEFYSYELDEQEIAEFDGWDESGIRAEIATRVFNELNKDKTQPLDLNLYTFIKKETDPDEDAWAVLTSVITANAGDQVTTKHLIELEHKYLSQLNESKSKSKKGKKKN